MPIDHRRLAAVWAVAFVLVNAVFLIWPGLDLAVSGLFYDGETGFFLAPSTTLEVIRQAIWRLSVVLVLACLAAGILQWLGIIRDFLGVAIALTSTARRSRTLRVAPTTGRVRYAERWRG